MKRIWGILLLLSIGFGSEVYAGFGIQVGALSPTTGLDDNDNGLILGVDFALKFALFGVKAEALYVDSEGRYTNELGDIMDHFAQADIAVEGILAADLLYYPVATAFFIQAGLNYTTLDASDLENIDGDVIDNQLGLDLGVGITLFDKLLVQAKAMYTPNAINGSAADSLNLEKNLFGYMASVGWRF